MAARNGININSIPFEQRYQPPDPKRRKRERLTPIDRLICAFFGAILGFMLWTYGYVILVSKTMKVAARQAHAAKGPIDPLERLPSFWWGGSVATGFALFGAVVGAERMMDGFGKAVRVSAEIARAVNRS
jgi:hypothetical protein